MIRIGCIGCGAWGKNLLRVWDETDGSCVGAACRQDASRLHEVGEQYPDATLYSSPAELIADASIDAVSIATPPVTHCALAKQALLARKHVFVEKPMCLDSDEARKLAELADARDRVLMVGHLMEHHGPVKAVKALLDEGAIGELRHMHFQRLKLGRVRTEENVLWSFAPHDLSVVSFLLGAVPQSVRATGYAYLQPDVEDIVYMDACYAQGVTMHVHVSWLHPESVRKVVLVGTEAMIVWDDMAKTDKVTLSRKSIAPDLSNQDAGDEPVPYEDSQPLQNECAAFIECINSNARPVNDGWDGWRVVRMLEAATEALASGTTVSVEQ